MNKSTLQISENFTLADVEFNEWAVRTGINNEAPIEIIEAAERLAEFGLEPLLTKFPNLSITSWYRSPALEREYGRSTFAFKCILDHKPINEQSWKEYMEGQQHATGCAATIRVHNKHKEAFEYIRDNLEFDILQDKGGWISVSFCKINQKRVINR